MMRFIREKKEREEECWRWVLARVKRVKRLPRHEIRVRISGLIDY